MPDENSKLTKFFRKIGDVVLNMKGLPGKARKAKPSFSVFHGEPKREIPSFLQEFFRRRNAKWPEYVMLKVQISVVLLFGSAVILVAFPSWASEVVLVPLVLIFAGYTLYLAPTHLKPAFGRDYPAYRSFVWLCVGIALGLILTSRLLPFGIVGGPFQSILTVALMMGAVLGAFASFKLKYGRDYTYGVVKRIKGDRAAVRVSYDIKSNVKHGLYFLESLVDVEPGDEVKVRVDRSIMGLRGSEPTAILEKAE